MASCAICWKHQVKLEHTRGGAICKKKFLFKGLAFFALSLRRFRQIAAPNRRKERSPTCKRLRSLDPQRYFNGFCAILAKQTLLVLINAQKPRADRRGGKSENGINRPLNQRCSEPLESPPSPPPSITIDRSRM